MFDVDKALFGTIKCPFSRLMEVLDDDRDREDNNGWLALVEPFDDDGGGLGPPISLSIKCPPNTAEIPPNIGKIMDE